MDRPEVLTSSVDPQFKLLNPMLYSRAYVHLDDDDGSMAH